MSKEEEKGVVSEETKTKKTDKKEALNDEVARTFDDILDSDEKIVESYKPNKAKTYFSNIMTAILPMVLFLCLCFVAFLIPSEEPVSVSETWIALGTCIGIVVVLSALLLVFTELWYRHTIYAVTEKRIIIRTGIFGVDYKSLDIKSIGATDVYVSLLDKILCKKTGSLKFGSNSSPILSKSSSYNFAHIKEPYAVYKVLKAHIEKVQKTEVKE